MALVTFAYSLRLTTCRRFFSARPAIGQYREFEPHGTELPQDFRFFPHFLNDKEQRILLTSALRQLDNVGSRAAKRKRKGKAVYDGEDRTISTLFLPDEYYEFEEGHFDGVIRHFRETHVTSWPRDPFLEPVLLRLRSLLPVTLDIQTHLLHLASNGEISPHIDNVDASGSWIAAVSIGGERVLRMEGPRSFEILLPSGSAYVQKNAVRYSYKHSILYGDQRIPASQRLSVMLRDRLPPDLKSRPDATSSPDSAQGLT